MQNKTDFITKVHQKIHKKKRQRVNITSIALSICIVVSLMLYQNYSFTDSEQLLASLNEPTQIEVYKWEYMEELTQEELLLYLIDEQFEEEMNKRRASRKMTRNTHIVGCPLCGAPPATPADLAQISVNDAEKALTDAEEAVSEAEEALEAAKTRAAEAQSSGAHQQ